MLTIHKYHVLVYVGTFQMMGGKLVWHLRVIENENDSCLDFSAFYFCRCRRMDRGIGLV